MDEGTHVAWTAMLYLALTVVRAPTAWGLGARPDGSNPFGRVEPRVCANLSNQFEWPLFFHAVCLLLVSERVVFDPLQIWLAWTFVIGRVLHSGVQIATSGVRLRGLVFTINFVAVLAMWYLILPVRR